MVKYINEITREFGIEHHTLRNWEEKGYLGVVERDFTHGRMYDEEQVEKIKTIQDVVLKQRDKGMKRTDFKEVERVLLDKFGGMVEARPKNIPATPAVFENMVLKMEKQEKQIQDLQQLILDLTKATKGLPQQENIMTKEQAEQLHSRLTGENKEMKEEMKLLKEKLDIAVDYIQKQENEEKKGFWKRLFG
ncbi:MerR family transcriptional regulator [Bacilli bacterium]|uniref:helix-turn-helix domain-containing protein n=2 Tax=Bacteria TaxID=2 RepID=UPI0006216AE5|nr:hypothetical protein WH51_14170 [Bacilli bacterium VT-13-104]PZD83266.1 MerR family transcriptional regulator [Bacilli bacterium]PZD84450.1 MerR family transcriptional regulator [Bacilli bacterium]PZD86682.1 MerR family transcriptional regulator [Bacilli bacterium]RCO04330.1 MerR family transcriptional regulator [Bacilli bacterium]